MLEHLDLGKDRSQHRYHASPGGRYQAGSEPWFPGLRHFLRIRLIPTLATLTDIEYAIYMRQ
jgi:hypothetical protein